MTQPPPNITVEFYGIARQRAGVDEALFALAPDATGITLGELLMRLTTQHPNLAGECVAEGRLGPACAANLNGDAFVRAPETLVRAGQTLMLLSADAGG